MTNDSNDKKRKAFQYLPGNENPQFLEDERKIYLSMKNKYPNSTDEDLDNILNGICASLIFLIMNNVHRDNHHIMLQLIWNILNKNI